MNFFEFILFQIHSTSQFLFCQTWKVFSHYVFKYFFRTNTFPLFFWKFTYMNIIYFFLLLTHRSLRPYSFFSVFFSFSCLDWIISIYLSSRPLAVSSQVFSLAHPVHLLVPLLYFSVLKFPFSSPLYSLFLC